MLVAIDVNNVQNAVLELKISGIKSLEHLQFLKLLGETPAQSDERSVHEQSKTPFSSEHGLHENLRYHFPTCYAYSVKGL